MSSRRIACLLLGLWLGFGLLAAWVAIRGQRVTERLIADPTPAAALDMKVVGTSAAALLRYQEAEWMRQLQGEWGTAQMALGAAFFVFLLLATREGKIALGLALAMLLISVAQRFMIDSFGGAYWGAEMGKWAAGVALAETLTLRGRSRDARD